MTNNQNDTKNGNITHEKIAARAYERYSQRGHESGHEVEDWLWAETTLRAQANASSQPAQATQNNHAEPASRKAAAPPPPHERQRNHGR